MTQNWAGYFFQHSRDANTLGKWPLPPAHPNKAAVLHEEIPQHCQHPQRQTRAVQICGFSKDPLSLESPWVKPDMVSFSYINNPFEGTVWHFTHLPWQRRELAGLLKGLISTFNTRGKFRWSQMLEIKLSAVETAGLLASHRLGCLLQTDTHMPPSMAPLPNPAGPLLS